MLGERGYDSRLPLALRYAEVIFNDTVRRKILIDASTTPRLTRHENYGKARAIHQFKKFSHATIFFVPNHL